MGGRDHSIECEKCGVWYGGIDDTPCDCEILAATAWTPEFIHAMCNPDGCPDVRCLQCSGAPARLERLATNLAMVGALCLSFDLGYFEQNSTTPGWWPNTEGRPAPGWTVPDPRKEDMG